jgi:ADP-dependent NAD(P)H-hydrate dehydratase / NAD(P)H-hydrate epimerase
MRLPTRLLRRKADSHKGDFGHVFILAGSARFSGAAVLCAEAAMRSGAGLVTLGIPKGINSSVIKIKPKEVMTLPLPETKTGSLGSLAYKKIRYFCKNIDILALGPGLSQEKETQQLIRKVITTTDVSAVIDADGLNALKGRLDLLKKRQIKGSQTLITPHPGEMARLLGVSVAEVQKNRKDIAKKFANEYNVTIVLKGRNTVVAGPHSRIYINKTGNPGMATAGSGDVLTGMIAAFFGQGLNSFEAAKHAVYLHGLAGDLAAKEKTRISLIASDIIEKIPEAIKKSSFK